MYGLPDSAAGYYAMKYLRQSRKLAARAAAFPIRMQFQVVDVKIYDAALRKELQSPSGIVWKWLRRRGEFAVSAAKRQVGVRTGALRQSIHMKQLANATGQYLWIGSKKNYAYLHHEGSRPHFIVPTKAEVLRFSSGSRVIYSRRVLHPGTRPNRYLSDQLKYFTMKM